MSNWRRGKSTNVVFFSPKNWVMLFIEGPRRICVPVYRPKTMISTFGSRQNPLNVFAPVFLHLSHFLQRVNA